MTHPTDTLNFDTLSAGVSGISAINRALAQLSYAISQLQSGVDLELITIPVTAAESFLANDAAYLNPSDSQLYAIDANAAPALAGTVRGFIQDNVSVSGLATLVVGGVLGGFTGLTAWLPVYADATGAGTVTQTRPYPLLDSGQMAIVPMGMAISATQVAVLPSFMDCAIRYQKRFSPALDETTTIEHGEQTDGFGRMYAAYVTQNNTLTEYASSNRDSDVQLRGASGAGGTTTPDAVGVILTAIGNIAGTHYREAQSFQVTAGQLSQITTGFGATTGSPTGVVTWRIHSDSAGIPGTVLQSGTFTPTASSNNVISVTNGVFLSAATTYWLSYEAAAQSSGNYWTTQRNDAGAYANGQFKWDTSATPTFPDTWVGGGGARDLRCSITTTAIVVNDKLSQGFQIATASTVSKVRLWLKKVGSPTGNLTAKIQTDTAGSPSGTTVTNGTSATVAASSLSTSYGYIDFTFSTPPNLSAATQYHIVLETADSQSDTNYVVWGADGSSPSYTNGEMKRERSAAWSAESKDAVFQVSTDGLQYINPVTVDWWSSTHADMVAQAGDTGGSTIDTKTTFKCKAAAGFADVTVEVT
jgi:hypothetical protein